MAYWRCECGAQNDATNPTCEYCGAGATGVTQKSASTWNAWQCSRCPDTSRDTGPFYQDTRVVEDRGARLCPSCWILALKRRADTSLEARCTEPGCGKTVRQHMAEVPAFIEDYAAGRIQARMRHWPTILERRGIHPPRPGVDMTIPEKLGWDDPASLALRERMNAL